MNKINFHISVFKVKVRDWFLKHAESPHMKAWLAFFSFTEAVIFPIPPDLLLIPIIAVHARRWIYYVLFTTAASVLGGILGYIIGSFLFEFIGTPIIEFYGFEGGVEKVGKLFSDNAFLAIFVSAFSPIPYKIFTLSAGFFAISFPTFVLASLLGRLLRFFIVGFLAKRFGRLLGGFLFTYFNAISLIAAAIIVALVIFL